MKCAVLIPCKAREEDLVDSLPTWLNQTYKDRQIVVIDYSSPGLTKEVVRTVAQKHSICDISNYDPYAELVYIYVPNCDYFNISHAYNYALTRIQWDVLQTVCADSCAQPSFLERVMDRIDDKTLVYCWHGLQALTYYNWKKLNGHQEFIVGWGAEDDDMIERAKLIGIKPISLDKELVHHLSQTNEDRVRYRENKNIKESAYINAARMLYYRIKYGARGNYGEVIGRDKPIRFRDQMDTDRIDGVFKRVRDTIDDKITDCGLVELDKSVLLKPISIKKLDKSAFNEIRRQYLDDGRKARRDAAKERKTKRGRNRLDKSVE